MLKKRRNLKYMLPAVIVLSLLAGSCKDDTGTLGLDILPQEDLFTGSRSIVHLKAQNFNPEYFRSDDASIAILGSVNDEFAGKTTASFVTQVTLSSDIEKLKVDDDYFVDSMVFILPYKKNWWFGDDNAKFNVKVHKFNGPLSADEDYFSNFSVEGLYDPTPIGTRLSSARDNKHDTIWDEANYIHYWRIKLDEATTNEFFNFPKETMASKENFKEAFPGLYVTAEPVDEQGTGSLISLDLLSQSANLTLYYHYLTRDDDNLITDTIETGYIFPINKECVRINRFEHDAQDIIDFTDPNPNPLIVQGMAGSYVKFDLRKSEGGPIDFEEWEKKLDPEAKDTYHGISAVDIFFKVDTLIQKNNENFYSPIPESLDIYAINEDGELEELVYKTGIDSDPTRKWFEGGIYNPDTQEYQFRMVREFFEILVKGEDVSQGPFVLASPNPVSDIRRVAFKNNEDTNDNLAAPRIDIKYVTFTKP